jgi:thiamine-phosphate pyrophosphorylase
MIDANLNRASEGLRVLEDVARFLLSDAGLSGRLRTLRHYLAQQTRSLGVGLLSERNSEHDVGHTRSVLREDRQTKRKTTRAQGLLDLVSANAKRVEESLRVIEELAKLPELSPVLNPASFEQARFTLYTLERDLIARTSRRNKARKISGLYVILDRQFLAGRDELDIAGQVIEGGARVLQFRDKQSKKGELLLVAQKLKKLCNDAGVLFMINDYLDLALAADADGLHIGQDDLPLSVVRRQLPIDKIVGYSVNTLSQATKAEKGGADYIAVGSVFPTATKKEATVIGVDIVRELKRKLSIPLVAIGGINRDNIGEVIAAGADAIAVISAALGEEDVRGAVRKLAAKMELAKGNVKTGRRAKESRS